MASVKLEDIKYEIVTDKSNSEFGQEMLNNEIPCANVCYYTRKNGETKIFKRDKKVIRILFLCYGNANVSSSNTHSLLQGRSVYTDMPNTDITVNALSDIGLLEIKWELNNDDLQELISKKDKFPFTESYLDALQYRDPFKSETTISRAIIVHDFIPRFAMGSVEAKGDDLVGQHSHPLLDQFFFSFPENDADLLIDCRIFNLKGNTLVHIPLGSNHGVIAKGNQRMHYLWLDFTPANEKEDAVAYLNEVHKPTGVKEELK